jgi:hypothetical protein
LDLPGPIWKGIYFHSLLYCSFLQTSYIVNYQTSENPLLNLLFSGNKSINFWILSIKWLSWKFLWHQIGIILKTRWISKTFQRKINNWHKFSIALYNIQ